ncbi:Uncharacterised protein [Streptococcus pneumoniae]|nr:Uncharacterised protein [Streptococcus pneumoniae]CJB32192.1 Uncharacterised protein [Streptococcus pneumoniae]COG67205.1 Uncharacterised protein [Streptococcus pneumoniae]CRG01084.1 Uncharacterised protein [Streptococcus pneumoniae]
MSCAPKAAGVACVISEVATSPVDFPFSFACSRTVFTSALSLSTAIAALYVLIPADIAVAADAESVIFSCSSSGYVFCVPTRCLSNSVDSISKVFGLSFI